MKKNTGALEEDLFFSGDEEAMAAAARELEGSGAAREEWSGRRINDRGGGGIYSAVNLR